MRNYAKLNVSTHALFSFASFGDPEVQEVGLQNKATEKGIKGGILAINTENRLYSTEPVRERFAFGASSGNRARDNNI